MNLFYDVPLDAFVNRTARFDIELRSPNRRDAAQLGSDDVVRFKLYRADDLLDLTSAAPTAAGSGLQILTRGDAQTKQPAVVRLTLAQGDLATHEPATYDAEVLVVEPSAGPPANPARVLARGTVRVHPSAGGAIGL